MVRIVKKEMNRLLCFEMMSEMIELNMTGVDTRLDDAALGFWRRR